MSKPKRNIIGGLENNPTQGSDIVKVLLFAGLMFGVILIYPPLAFLIAGVLLVAAIVQGLSN